MMNAKPDRTFFVDESGDSGDSPNPHNRFFSMVALTGNSGRAEEVREVSTAIQDSLKSSYSTNQCREFKWRHVSDSMKNRVIRKLAQAPLKFFAVAYDKPRCRKEFPEYLATSNALYRHAFETLFETIEKHLNGHLEFLVDRSTQEGIEPIMVRAAVSFGSLPSSATEEFDDRTYTLKFPLKDSRLTARAVRFVDSYKDPGIQLADFIAGGIRYWSARPGHPLREILRPIEGGIVQIPIDMPGETALPTVLKAEAPINPQGSSHFSGIEFKFDPPDVPPKRKQRNQGEGKKR